jgi:SnoaL-like domain
MVTSRKPILARRRKGSGVEADDERAIRQVLLRYSRGIDRRDAELVRSCYHEDATDSHGRFHGTRDEFVDWVIPNLGRYASTSHYLMNMLIEVEGDGALSETYATAYHAAADEADTRGNYVVGFRYIDRFARRQGEWRIAERVVALDWVQDWSPDRVRLEKMLGQPGRPGPEDPLYEIGRRALGRDLRA